MAEAARQDARLDDRLEIARIELLHRSAPLSQVTSIICTIVVFGILMGYADRLASSLWLGASLALVGLRLALARRSPLATHTAVRVRRWANEFAIGSFLNGLLFLIPAVWLIPPASTPQHFALVGITGILPAMALTTLAAYRPALIAFCAPLLLVYGLAAMFVGEWLPIAMGLAAIVYFCVVVAISAVVDRDVRQALQRRFDVEALNADLVQARAAAESAAHGLARHGQELERRVDERTASLTRAMHELESFSYSVSHDLRTPLRAINGYATLLDEECGGMVTPHAREYLARIRKATERLDCLIDELLDLSRMTRAEMNVHPVDLSALGYSVAAECASLFPDRRVAVRIAPGMHVHGDPVLLRVLLQNLFWNAWKFTAPRAEARIEFDARGEPDAPGETGANAYCVSDNGVGFDMRFADKLFKPFQRLHGVSEFPGSGIGLATVARIVARHGGRVWANSRPGEGARFCFTLGRPDVEPGADVAPAAAQ
ncbi:MAG TPA: ATP-binding protein [Rhodocyclaceae bacterium]|nr:ATP-binding protein [Rhodocyclaceae bacterium]